jgi:hypothetical protein
MRVKTFHALDRAATVIGHILYTSLSIIPTEKSPNPYANILAAVGSKNLFQLTPYILAEDTDVSEGCTAYIFRVRKQASNRQKAECYLLLSLLGLQCVPEYGLDTFVLIVDKILPVYTASHPRT